MAFRTETVGVAAIRPRTDERRLGSDGREEHYKQGHSSRKIQIHPLPFNPELPNSHLRAHWVLQVTYSCFQMLSPSALVGLKGSWRPGQLLLVVSSLSHFSNML